MSRVRRFEQADAEGALDLHVVAEGAGEMNGAERAHLRAEALEEQPETRGDGALGQLQLANVGLVEDDGRGDGKNLCTVGDAAVGEDGSAAQARGDGVDQAAAADAARRSRRR